MEGYYYSPRPFEAHYSLTGDYFEESVVADDTDQDEDLPDVLGIGSPSRTDDAQGGRGFSPNTIPTFTSYPTNSTRPTTLNLGAPDATVCQHEYERSSGECWPCQNTLPSTPHIPTTDYLPTPYSPIWPADTLVDNGPQWTNLQLENNTCIRRGSEDSTDDSSTRCWEHGCNGRRFSTRGNLVRHQKEKAKREVKAYCFNCGAFFTRTTARDKHIINQSCGRIRRYSNGRIRPLFARSMGLSDVTSGSNAANGALDAFVEDFLRNDRVSRSPEWLEITRH
ncbi:hypothetical protein F4677DRAFT_22062 [Hypoxylon crocopeplum]|nr:hypothetical protein F4677DRAFT_22062 [Hypoxylon crocopeplum]